MRRRVLSLFVVLLAPLALAVAPAHADTAVDTFTELPFTTYGDHAVDRRHGLVFVTGDGEDDPLVVTTLGGELVRTVPELAGAHRVVTSRDGRWLYVSIGTDVRRLDPVTLEEVDRYPINLGYVDDMTVAGGSLWVSAGNPFRRTYWIDVSSGEVEEVSDDGGTFYRTRLLALGRGGIVAMLGYEHEPRVSTIDAHTGRLLATRAFHDDAVLGGLHQEPGGLGLVRRLNGEDTVLRLDPRSLRTTAARAAPPDANPISASAGQGLLAIGVRHELDHGSVKVASLRSGRTRNEYRLAFGNPLNEVGVVDTFFTAAGLVAVSEDFHEQQPVRLHVIPTPGARSANVSFLLPEDAVVGEATLATGRLTYRGAPVPDAAVRISDTNMYGEVLEPRRRIVRTDDRGRFSLSYTPRFAVEQITVRSLGTRRAPEGWLRAVEEIRVPPSEVVLHAPETVVRGETLVVTGAVTSRGLPAGHSHVNVVPSCPQRLATVYTTDAEGRFSLTFPTDECTTTTVDVYSEGNLSSGGSPVSSVTVRVVEPTPPAP